MDLTLDLSTKSVGSVLKAIHDFSKSLINMMDAAWSDLNAVANSVELNVLLCQKDPQEICI